MNYGPFAHYPYPLPSAVHFDADGNVVDVVRLRFVNLRDIRPLNRKQIAKREAA